MINLPPEGPRQTDVVAETANPRPEYTGRGARRASLKRPEKAYRGKDSC